MRKVLVTLENYNYFLFYAETFLPKWRTGFVSISTSGFGNSQVSNLQVHSITTNFLRSRWLACLWRGVALFYVKIITFVSFTISNDLVLQAIEVAQIIDQALDGSNNGMVLKCIKIADARMSSEITQFSTSESMAPFLSCFSAPHVYSKVVLLGISFLEREHRYGSWNYRLLFTFFYGHCLEYISTSVSNFYFLFYFLFKVSIFHWPHKLFQYHSSLWHV